MIFGFLACLFLAFLVGGLESGLASIDRLRLRQDARREVPGAVRLEKLLARPTLLMGTLACLSAGAKFLALIFVLGWLQLFFAPATGFLIGLGLLPVVILFGELLPKAVCRRFPRRVLPFFEGFLCSLSWFLRPVYWLPGRWARSSGSPGGTPAKQAGAEVVSVAELRRATNRAVETGALQPLQKHFIHSILNAHEVPVGELSLPLSALPSLPGNTRVEDVIGQSRQTGRTRWLVCQESGAVLGQLRTFDLLLDDTHQGSAQSYVRRIPEIPGDKPLLPALLTMRTLRANIALVQSPGAPPEIVSAESLVRRILLGSSQVPSTEAAPAGNFAGHSPVVL